MKKILLVTLFLFPLIAVGNLESVIIKDGDRIKLYNFLTKGGDLKVSNKDPLYPPYLISREVKNALNSKPANIIKRLEDLLTKENQKGKVENQLLVGTVKSFRLWRELLYLSLARAYYEIRDFNKALYYYNGIPKDSIWYKNSSLELAWTYLQLNKLNECKNLVDEISGDTPELKLIKTFYLVKTGDFQDAIDLGKNINFEYGTMLSNLKYEVLAQAYFSTYLKKLESYTYEEKVEHLDTIIKLVNSVNNENKDPEFSYLVAETYWHKASVYRVKDPVKYDTRVKKLLNLANDWITPWFNLSVKEKHAKLSEEATFFSIALLWEQEKYEEGLNRLKHFPQLFPQGEYLEDVYQLLGDYYYNENKFSVAVNYYRQLATYGTDEKAAYGVYKAAWSFYNSGKKWPGLRHFERLLLHYRNLGLEQDDLKNIEGVAKEAKDDLLTVMAEMLDYKQAFEEIKIFKFNPEETLNFKSSLGDNYQSIGRNGNAAHVWENLLDNNIENLNSYTWLLKLSTTRLSMGDKINISTSLNKYLPQIQKIHKESFKEEKAFETELSKIILTVHKEARKSDNKEDWPAVDKLYDAYEKYLTNSKIGDVWYYGAQRKEKLGKKWEAVEWYKKASVIADYVSAKDGANSVLSILQSENESLSLKNSPTPEEMKIYKDIISGSKWYIDTFPDNKEKQVADFIYLEALYHTNQLNVSHEYIISNFKSGSNKSSWDKFVEENRRLYRDKKWDALFKLTKNIYENAKDLTSEQKISLLKIYYESSFEQAFALEKEKNSNSKEIVNWYQITFTQISNTYFEELLALKAWHNLLITLQKRKEYVLYEELLTKYLKSDFHNIEEENLSFDFRNLKLDIFKSAIVAYRELEKPIERIKMLTYAAQYAEEDEQKESMLWESLVLYGSYYDSENLIQVTKNLKEKKAKILDETTSKDTLSKIYYYNEEYKQSWEYLSDLLNRNGFTPNRIMLLHDLFFKSKEEDEDVYSEVKNYLVKNIEKLKKNGLLVSIWSHIYKDEIKIAKENWEKYEDKYREIASKDEDGSDISKALKTRAEKVFFQINNLVALKEELKKSITDWKPRISEIAICEAPKLTTNAIEHLNGLKTPKIETPQWSEFLTKLDLKINELKTVKAKEIKGCEEYRKRYALLSPLDSPLKKYYFETKSPDSDDIIELENSWKEKKNISNYEKVFEYLKIGALARTEYFISNLKDNEEGAFYVGLLRLASSDPWNAASIFKEQSKIMEFKNHSKIFLSLIYKLHGFSEESKSILSKIPKTSIKPFEKDLQN